MMKELMRLSHWTCNNQRLRREVINMVEMDQPDDPFMTEFSDERFIDGEPREAIDSVDGEIEAPKRPTTWFDCTRTVSDPYSNYGMGNSERDLF